MAHTHDHQQSGIECCAHGELESERWIVLYMIAAVLLTVSWIAGLLEYTHPSITVIPAAVAAVALWIPLAIASWKEISRGAASSSTLVALAVLAAIVTQNYLAGGFLAFVLLVADQVIRRTAWGAQRAIEQLINLTPDVARVLIDGREEILPVEQVAVGQIVRVRPGENLPIDGRVISGRSTINQASLTGEAMPVSVQPGDPVYAGTENITGGIDVEVTQVGAQTAIGRVSQLIREAESVRTPRQLIIEQVAKFFVPVAVAVAFVVWFIASRDPATQADAANRAITVLVVACPAALLLASPSATVGAFAAAARLGVMIKESRYLEAAANIDTVIMDKTGTITTGEFGVTRLVPAEGVEGAELLKAAANAEMSSNHPLALSIISTARQARIQLEDPEEFEEIHGRGVKARTSLGTLYVGNAKWLMELNPDIRPQVEAVQQKIPGMTGVHVMRDRTYLGVVGLEDKIRKNTKQVIEQLRSLGVKQIAIFTGDRLDVAKRVGLAIGADAIEAECLPEEKHQQVKSLTKAGYRTMVVGDGINDGPSLAAADVGVAMGLGGSDIAANSAGIALMTDDLSRLPFIIELSRRMRAILIQNIAASIIIVIVGLVISAAGLLAVPLAAAYHFAGDVFVLANSFRLFRFGEEYAAVDTDEEEAHIRRREASVRGLTSAQPA